MRELEIVIDVGDRDLSFLSEMLMGGISDDGSPLVGDVSFSDFNNYESNSTTDEEVYAFMRDLNIN